ncbi:hypothetical protein Taro_025302 [Colocasia esculenta]|uniref:Uncharacterized protein n=1 Tax=Colocasia esculenta TaxID=4460 RepID=A0A843V8J3_COLES|nr:hypothetical protein [Colocasia esculenta]
MLPPLPAAATVFISCRPLCPELDAAIADKSSPPISHKFSRFRGDGWNICDRLNPIFSHLVVFEVCKHRRKSLAKTVFLSKSLHISMLPVFVQK